MRMRPFEIGVLVVFGLLAVLALLLLRMYSPEPEEDGVAYGGSVVVWGTLPYEAFQSVRAEIEKTDTNFKVVEYRYIDPASFDEEFINALADQAGPDLILVSHERMAKHLNRIQLFPYTAFPQRDFRNLYVDGAEIFLLPQGIFGFPVAVNPIVMYWNRDIFTVNGFLTPPVSWEEVVGDVVPRLTTRDFNRNIIRSGIAMGEYSNIKNAYGILSTLTLQGGSAGVVPEEFVYRIRLDESVSVDRSRPFTNAVTFFTNFNAVPNTLYSWNRSLALDRDVFLREELALYFGYGNEGRELAARNPNLNFDIAEVPQSAVATVKRTYAEFYALAVPKQTKNQSGAYQVLQKFWDPNTTQAFARAVDMAPPHRSALAAGSNDLYGRVYYNAATYARAWINPDRVQVDEIFSRMLLDVAANRADAGTAVADALIRLERSY